MILVSELVGINNFDLEVIKLSFMRMVSINSIQGELDILLCIVIIEEIVVIRIRFRNFMRKPKINILEKYIYFLIKATLLKLCDLKLVGNTKLPVVRKILLGLIDIMTNFCF